MKSPLTNALLVYPSTKFLKRYKEVLSPKQIVKELGYSVNILRARRAEGLRDHIVKESLSEAGLPRGRFTAKSSRVQGITTTLPESKAIKYMQHELLYLRQELEFLKKIAADNAGKRTK